MIHRYRITLLVAAVIAVASLMPGGSLPKISWSEMISLDKWAHFLLYGLLSFVLTWERIGSVPRAGWRTGLVILAACALYGILLEGIQLLSNQGRYFEVLDIIANIIGSLAGTLLCLGVRKKE